MKSFVISAVVLAVLSLLLGFAVHAALLAGDYAQLPNMFRPEKDAQNYFPFMLAAHALIAVGMTWIYRQGNVPGQPWVMQGLRFGIGWAIAVCIPTYLIYFAVQPMPSSLVTRQIMFDSAATIIMGLVCALLNRNANRSAFA